MVIEGWVVVEFAQTNASATQSEVPGVTQPAANRVVDIALHWAVTGGSTLGSCPHVVVDLLF